jgi:hypothetical protein
MTQVLRPQAPASNPDGFVTRGGGILRPIAGGDSGPVSS